MRLGALLAILLATASPRSGDARNATGYVAGTKTTVKLTDVNGKDVEVRTAKAFRVMQKAAHKHGVSLSIRSGFRSFEKQAKLYKKYRRGQGNLAAPPGYSNHESGRALDINLSDRDALSWLNRNGATYGFHRTVPGEAWHWEYLGDEDRTIARPSKHKRDRKTS